MVCGWQGRTSRYVQYLLRLVGLSLSFLVGFVYIQYKHIHTKNSAQYNSFAVVSREFLKVYRFTHEGMKSKLRRCHGKLKV